MTTPSMLRTASGRTGMRSRNGGPRSNIATHTGKPARPAGSISASPSPSFLLPSRARKHRPYRPAALASALHAAGAAPAARHIPENKRGGSTQAAAPLQRSGNGLASAFLAARRVREEELLAIHLVARDRLLALIRDQPVGEFLRHLDLDIRALIGADGDHAILVEELLIALDHDLEIALVAEIDPGCAVRERVGIHPDRSVERRAHAASGL